MNKNVLMWLVIGILIGHFLAPKVVAVFRGRSS